MSKFVIEQVFLRLIDDHWFFEPEYLFSSIKNLTSFNFGLKYEQSEMSFFNIFLYFSSN